MLIGPLRTTFNEILLQIHTFSFKKIHLKNVVWKMAAILSRPQCVKKAVAYHNEIWYTSRQYDCRDVYQISLW